MAVVPYRTQQSTSSYSAVPVSASSNTTVLTTVNNPFMATANSVQSSTTTPVMLSNNPSLWNAQINAYPNSTVVQNQTNGDWEENLRSFIKTIGFKLKDGGWLILEDDEPVITYRHEDDNPDVIKPFPKRHFPIRHSGVIDLNRHLIELGQNAVLRTPDGKIFQITKDGNLSEESYINIKTKTVDVQGGNLTLYESLAFNHFGEINIPKDCKTQASFVLANGVKIHLHDDDTIEVDDKNATRVYRSTPILNFNEYLSASDTLEKFISFCVQQNMSRKDFSELPISVFIYWLIVEASKADGDSTDDVLPMLTTAIKEQVIHSHRCKDCGRYLKKSFKDHGISFCSSEHMTRYMSRVAL